MKQAFTLLSIAVLVIAFSAPAAQSRTWYVNVYGTGDAPTIWAAMDSAVAGDSVLVGPGEYLITYDTGTLEVRPGVYLKSRCGPLETRLLRGFMAGIGVDMDAGSTVDGFWIDTFPTASVFTDESGVFVHCIVSGGITYVYGGVLAQNLFLSRVDFTVGFVDFHNNIVLGSMTCAGVPGGQVQGLYCNDVLGEIEPCIVWSLEVNFIMDPQFCGAEGSDNYYLQSSSPCAPGNTPLPFVDCGLIGPLPVACGPVRVEETTWGRVKALYGE